LHIEITSQYVTTKFIQNKINNNFRSNYHFEKDFHQNNIFPATIRDSFAAHSLRKSAIEHYQRIYFRKSLFSRKIQSSLLQVKIFYLILTPSPQS